MIESLKTTKGVHETLDVLNSNMERKQIVHKQILSELILYRNEEENLKEHAGSVVWMYLSTANIKQYFFSLFFTKKKNTLVRQQYLF